PGRRSQGWREVLAARLELTFGARLGAAEVWDQDCPRRIGRSNRTRRATDPEKQSARTVSAKGSRVSGAGGREPLSRREGSARRRRSPIRSGRFLFVDAPAFRPARRGVIRG